MKKKYNIAVVGLGQVGIYLLNELNTKKKNTQPASSSAYWPVELTNTLKIYLLLFCYMPYFPTF